MMILMGYLYLDPSDVIDFVADMETVSASTRAEDGCLFHGICLDDARAGRMLVAQRWRDAAALTAHLTTRTTVAFLAKWGSRFRSELQQYDAMEERTRQG